MAKVIIELDDELKKKFNVKIAQEETTQKDVITELIKKYVKDEV